MAGYIGSKAVLLSTTAATVTGDMTVDTSTLKVDSSNNRVGIGTASPSHALHVDSGSTDGVALFASSGYANAYVVIKDSGSSDGAFIGAVGTSTVLGTGGSTVRMTIDSSGNVGIGTTTPDDELDIEGADPAIRLTDTSAGGYARVFANNGSLILQADEGGNVSNSIISFDIDGTEHARIDSDGDV